MSRRKTIAAEINAGVLPQGHELRKEDVGRAYDKPSNGWGKVLPCDIGKRVWLYHYGLVMENDDQMKTRKRARLAGAVWAQTRVTDEEQHYKKTLETIRARRATRAK